jgi:hypothetical protein
MISISIGSRGQQSGSCLSEVLLVVLKESSERAKFEEQRE